MTEETSSGDEVADGSEVDRAEVVVDLGAIMDQEKNGLVAAIANRG
jgi:hypothetical protein